MTDLAGAMRVPLSPASRVVDRLVAKDLVVRAPLPEDRRVVHVRFSRRGKRINQFVADAPQAAATRPLEALPPRDSAAVLHALDPMLEERN